MSLEHLSFLKRFAKPGLHYNFEEEANKIPNNTYAELDQLKNFSDDELQKLEPKIQLHAVDLNTGGYYTLMSKAKSKVVLPNLIAHHIAINPRARIEPHHHVFMKMAALTSKSIRDVCLAIPNKKSWMRGAIDSIPVEALHHPNLIKEHANEILESARKANNPYIDQMERQIKRRYK